jgi:hypothetical protein
MPNLELWVIYRHPNDYPKGFVVRRWQISDVRPVPVPDQAFSRADSLEDARRLVPAGLVCMPRSRGDDPVIAEFWL